MKLGVLLKFCINPSSHLCYVTVTVPLVKDLLHSDSHSDSHSECEWS